MTGYSVQPRDRIFVNGNGVLSFCEKYRQKYWWQYKNLSGKYSQKLLCHANQSTTDALKTISKRVIQKLVEATDDLIGNTIAG